MSVGLSVQRDKDFGHLGEGADAAAVGEDWKRGRNPAAELSPRAAVLLPGYARMQHYFPAGWRMEGWCLQQWSQCNLYVYCAAMSLAVSGRRVDPPALN